MEQFRKEDLVMRKCAKCGTQFKGEPTSEPVLCTACRESEERGVSRICNNCGFSYKGEKCPYCQKPPYRPEDFPL